MESPSPGSSTSDGSLLLPTRRLVTGSGARLLIRGLALAAAVVTVPLVTRYLGPSHYGYFAVAMSVVGLVTMLGNLGLPLFAGRDWPALDPRERDGWLDGLWRSRHFVTVVTCGLGLTAVLLAPVTSQIRLAMAVLLVGVPFALTGTMAGALFDATLDPLPAALSELVGRAAWVAGVVALVSWATGAGLIGVLAAVVVAQIVSTGVVGVMASRRGLLRWGGSLRPSRPILAGGLSLASLPFLTELYARADTLILALYAPATHVGVYGLQWRVVEILLVLIASVSATFVPVYATVRSPYEQGRVHARLVRLLATVTFPVAVVIAWLARPTLQVLGGSGFLELSSSPSAWLRVEWGLVLLMVAFACFSVAMANGPVLIARGRERALIGHLAFFTGANILLNFLLIPRWSLWGAAVATLATACLGIANSTRLVRKAGVAPGIPRELVWPISVAVATLAVLWLTRSLPWGVQLLAGVSAASATVLVTPLREDATWLLDVVLRTTDRPIVRSS